MKMAAVRAVLFDFGGTLYDYATLAAAEGESLIELARWAGVEAEPQQIVRAHRDALRRVFHAYLPRRFYLHRDLFRASAAGMLEDLGAPVVAEHLDRYRVRRWERHARDFTLREGVHDTLIALRERRVHVGMVSNIDEDQLAHLLAVSDVGRYFDSILSSEAARSCKPDTAIYEEALRRARCRPIEALFVGDSLQQDVAGAKRAGLRSVLLWHHPEREPPDGEPRPHHVIRRIPEVLTLL
ncbi:MAG: HAD family hydrolase [Candidatus Binatia bacterium]